MPLNLTLVAKNAFGSNEGRAPEWMYDFVAFRQSLFLKTIEPVIVTLLGPVDPTKPFAIRAQGYPLQAVYNAAQGNPLLEASSSQYNNYDRRLGFLPNYVENASAFRESSMSFATLGMLCVTMSCVVLLFLSCFYHNQKTSPLFISPRRHRLPKLVPPPLPVDGPLSWMKVCFYMSDEEIINRIGFDALIFLRFHRLALRCIVKNSVFSFLILLPLNFTGGGHANASDLKGYVGTLLFTDFCALQWQI